MNLTISEIITEIVTEVGGDISDTTFAATMLTFFKSGLRKIPTFIRDRLFITTETLSLSSGGQYVDLTGLTASFLKENQVWYVSSGNRIEIQKPPTRQYFSDVYTSENRAKPMYYIINGKVMYFDRPADEALTIGIEFFKEISSVITTDVFFGDERTLEAAKHLCKEGYYLDYEEDEPKSDKHALKAREILQELENDYEDQEFAGYIE